MSLTAPTPLAELENAAEFVARHIGPDAADEARMLSVIGAASREALISALVPKNIVRGQRDGDPRRHHRGAGAGRAEGAGRQEQGAQELHRPGLPRHDHAGRHPAQHPREPGLVHRLHALPGRDLAGPHGSAAQLPDHGHRPHRHGHRQRVDAGRSHRRRRGHDAGDAHGQEQEQGVLRRRRRAAADARGGAHARAAARRRGAGRPGRPGRRQGLLRRAVPISRRQWPGARSQAAGRCRSMRAAAWPSLPPTCSR